MAGRALTVLAIVCVLGAAIGVYLIKQTPTALKDEAAVRAFEFTLKLPQCLNYAEPQQSACKAEQASFDINGLVDRIASSIRML